MSFPQLPQIIADLLLLPQSVSIIAGSLLTPQMTAPITIHLTGYLLCGMIAFVIAAHLTDS
jgi:hypothetical protein